MAATLTLALKNILKLYYIPTQILDTQIVLNTEHTYRNTDNTVEIVKKAIKGKSLNYFKKYRIFQISKENVQMNAFNIGQKNLTFEIIYHNYPYI